ncbi:TPA: thymidine phosphorylase family protein [Pseudomonas aeruginosa]|nr:thymidine phosphorylase family protein [Pseudomonas aeruginosa]
MTDQGAAPPNKPLPTLRARRLGLHAQHQAIAIMRTDCHVCRAEGLASRSQVLLSAGGRHVQALLFQADGELIAPGEAALSESAWERLGVAEGTPIEVSHAPALDSLASVRRRIYGHRLDAAALRTVVQDVTAGRYTDVHLAAFLTASAALPLDEQETVDLTAAMIDVGEHLTWNAAVVVDKHCIGGLPGNRTTPIVVAIVAAHGLLMPKTSSRAITSPAGTADTMETLAPVDLDLATIQRVVDQEGGCIAWGGAVHLSPADDIFVRVERELDVDTEGQLIASVLSKKIAAGSNHVVLDIPVGPTAKVRTEEAARRLGDRLVAVAAHFGLAATCIYTDGTQPVGRGIGPALEALDILAVLQNRPDAAPDLRHRASVLAGAALEIGGVTAVGTGYALALKTLSDGRAWMKFQRICQAQGGMREPPRALHTRPLIAARSGRVVQVNNRKISQLAKLAGAPDAKAAGVYMNIALGANVARGQPLLYLHADTAGELAYAMEYASRNPDIIEITS